MSDAKVSDIEALLETFEASHWSEMKLTLDGLEMFVSKTPGAKPIAFSETGMTAPSGEVHSSPTPLPAPNGLTSGFRPSASPEHWVRVRAPNLGTFYRAPRPGAPPYVAIGQRVEPTTELCLIEVMKLFTTVLAGASGIVREVLVEDADVVEFDQPLMLIEPDA